MVVRLTAALTDMQRAQLDALLVVQPGARMTTLLATAFPRLRRYAPTLLDSLEFQGTTSSQSLLDGLKLLKELNASERLKRIPRDAPIEFISPRWEPHGLTKTGAIDRPFYELCALSTLRDRLRAGEVWVAGSRQYRAFDEYL